MFPPRFNRDLLNQLRDYVLQNVAGDGKNIIVDRSGNNLCIRFVEQIKKRAEEGKELPGGIVRAINGGSTTIPAFTPVQTSGALTNWNQPTILQVVPVGSTSVEPNMTLIEGTVRLAEEQWLIAQTEMIPGAPGLTMEAGVTPLDVSAWNQPSWYQALIQVVFPWTVLLSDGNTPPQKQIIGLPGAVGWVPAIDQLNTLISEGGGGTVDQVARDAADEAQASADAAQATANDALNLITTLGSSSTMNANDMATIEAMINNAIRSNVMVSPRQAKKGGVFWTTAGGAGDTILALEMAVAEVGGATGQHAVTIIGKPYEVDQGGNPATVGTKTFGANLNLGPGAMGNHTVGALQDNKMCLALCSEVANNNYIGLDLYMSSCIDYLPGNSISGDGTPGKPKAVRELPIAGITTQSGNTVVTLGNVGQPFSDDALNGNTLINGSWGTATVSDSTAYPPTYTDITCPPATWGIMTAGTPPGGWPTPPFNVYIYDFPAGMQRTVAGGIQVTAVNGSILTFSSLPQAYMGNPAVRFVVDELAQNRGRVLYDGISYYITSNDATHTLNPCTITISGTTFLTLTTQRLFIQTFYPDTILCKGQREGGPEFSSSDLLTDYDIIAPSPNSFPQHFSIIAAESLTRKTGLCAIKIAGSLASFNDTMWEPVIGYLNPSIDEIGVFAEYYWLDGNGHLHVSNADYTQQTK